MSEPKKIAVLGGGLAAITSVFHLLQDPDWKNKYDITVYQMGWRIGGKGASGVNIKTGGRIEEHGLHLWMGFYENAFSMMRTIYEANKRPPQAPLATFDDAFKGQPYMVFAENINGNWEDWKIPFPQIEGTVGDGTCGDFALLVKSIIDDILNKFKDYLKSKHNQKTTSTSSRLISDLIPEFLKKDISKISETVTSELDKAAHELLNIICELLIKLKAIEKEFLNHVVALIDNFKKWIWDLIGNEVYTNSTARHLWVSIDMFAAMYRGFVNDDMLQINDGVIQIDFDKVNNYDYGEWFEKNGADKKLTVGSPLIISMYDGPFAFIKGDITKPNIEAGTTLRNFLRLSFTCKENIVWRMQAGMGDTIFAPAYELMSRVYGVKFKFFSRVQNLKLSADKKSVSQIEISNQVRLKNNYNPLYLINGLNCWPSEPLYDQINDEDAVKLQTEKINLESAWTSWIDTGGITTLEHGKDFDQIILGASLGSMPLMCSELIASNIAWQQMVQNVLTVQTQAYQFWLNKSPEELNVEDQKLLSCYVEPIDTFSEMNQLLVRENWPADLNVKYIGYLCGAFPDATVIPPYTDHLFPEKEKLRAQQNLHNYFNQNLQHIIPGAFTNNVFDWNLLVDQNNQSGEQRLNAQYIRANIDPSERYVMSVKDSTQYRIKTNETGFSNLYITGDWTRNHFNSGFVECAVVAGILTARAVSGNNSIPIYLPTWDKTDF